MTPYLTKFLNVVLKNPHKKNVLNGSQKSLSDNVFVDRMRSLQRLNLATCTSELCDKRFYASSELPLNTIGSGVVRTEDFRHIILRPLSRLRCSSIEALKSETLPMNFSSSAKEFHSGPESIFQLGPMDNMGNANSS